MIRLFVALPLPNDIEQALAGLQSKIKGARWIQRSNLHITLQFIGEVYQDEYYEIIQELSDINFTSFNVQLKGLSFFGPASTPKVLWVSVEKNTELMQLQSLIVEKMDIIVPLELHKYVPHVTIARLNNCDINALSDYLNDHYIFESRDFTLKQFALYSSKLTPSGSIYQIEKKFELH